MKESVNAAAVSADGTVIAFNAWGEGEPLIIIDGATAYPAVNPKNEQVGRLLSDEYRTYARPPLPADYLERLDAAVAAGRPGDAAMLFLTAAVGMPVEGENHDAHDKVLAAALRDFARTH